MCKCVQNYGLLCYKICCTISSMPGAASSDAFVERHSSGGRNLALPVDKLCRFQSVSFSRPKYVEFGMEMGFVYVIQTIAKLKLNLIKIKLSVHKNAHSVKTNRQEPHNLLLKKKLINLYLLKK